MNSEKTLNFASQLSYEENCARLQTLAGWEWHRGDSDIFGQHMKGKNTEGEIIELFFLNGYTLDLVSTDEQKLDALKHKVYVTLGLLERS